MKKNLLSIYGAIIGDYYGSYWEFRNDKPVSFRDALQPRISCHFTDDTYMTVAIAKSMMMFGNLSKNAVKSMQSIGREFYSSYGASFGAWIMSKNPQPYYSWGNGASMRVSPVALSSKTLDEARKKARMVTEVTHDHPFALLYADIVTCIIFLAKEGKSMDEIKKFVEDNFKTEYGLIMSEDMSIDYLHENYIFTESSQDTVPQAIRCFFESKSFDDCLAKSLYVGGDSDTLAAISCSMASAFYGDGQVRKHVEMLPALPKRLNSIVKLFQKRYL